MKKKSVEYTLKAERREFPIVKIRSSEDAANFARNFYHEDILIYESSFIILMNHANNAIGYAKISQGGIAGTCVDVRLVVKYAIDSLASSVIFVHNHPSGNTNPSHQDINLTCRLNEALKILDIKLFDSIILTENSYTSLNDEGKL